MYSQIAHYLNKVIGGGRGCHVTGELVFPVTVAGLGAALVLMIAVFTVTIIKLQKDKRWLINSMAVQSSPGIVVNSSIKRDYENIQLCDQKAATKTVNVEVEENPAYSTAKDL